MRSSSTCIDVTESTDVLGGVLLKHESTSNQHVQFVPFQQRDRFETQQTTVLPERDPNLVRDVHVRRGCMNYTLSDEVKYFRCFDLDTHCLIHSHSHFFRFSAYTKNANFFHAFYVKFLIESAVD